MLAVAVLAVAALASSSTGGSALTVSRSVDRALCPFPLQVTVRSKGPDVSILGLRLIGPGTITLRNGTSGRTAIVRAAGTYSIDTATGSVRFRGRRLWLRSAGKGIPFLSTDGRGSLEGPILVLTGKQLDPRPIDPCALVAGAAGSTQPVPTKAPWGLPVNALGQIAGAGLIPVVGALVRHDHVHLDVLVDGKRVTVPGGLGAAEPVYGGPCLVGPRVGDCATAHFVTANVAYSPLHTHSTSGIVHIESDRSARFTLGQVFDEWGVRFDARCLGAYCSGGGKELRVLVDGKDASAHPRSIVLTNRQELAVVFGTPAQLEAAPAAYRGVWPGGGCGGPGERSCLPR